jgi:hypothetical protein
MIFIKMLDITSSRCEVCCYGPFMITRATVQLEDFHTKGMQDVRTVDLI